MKYRITITKIYDVEARDLSEAYSKVNPNSLEDDGEGFSRSLSAHVDLVTEPHPLREEFLPEFWAAPTPSCSHGEQLNNREQ